MNFNMNSFIIEKATITDAANILKYLKQIGGETDNLTFGEEGLPITPEEEEEYISLAENSCDRIMLVAKEEGKIVGSATLNRLSGRMDHRGDFSVSVMKEYWNKGIGSQLLLRIIEFAKENSFEIIDLQVRSDNLAAKHLYEKYGFKKIGTHSCFFKMGNEEISFDYMCLRL